MNIRDYRGYHIVLKPELSSEDLDQLIEALQNPIPIAKRPLGGRGEIAHCCLDQVGDLVIKRYQRGGLFRYFLQGLYLKWGASRPASEFKLLESIGRYGVRTPEPIGYIRQGRLFYRGWLITRYVEEECSLAEAAIRKDERLAELIEDVGDQVRALIQHGIYHVDLHPGNVLISRAGSAYILDFDKAAIYTGSKARLRDAYLCRWRRAVIKHNLPDELTELMSIALRRSL